MICKTILKKTIIPLFLIMMFLGTAQGRERLNEGSIDNTLRVTINNPSSVFTMRQVRAEFIAIPPFIDSLSSSTVILGDIAPSDAAEAEWTFDVRDTTAGETGSFVIQVTDATGNVWDFSDDSGLIIAVEVVNEFPAIAYVLDRSGSMVGGPLEAAKTAAKQGIASVPEGSELAVVSFNVGATADFSLARIRNDSIRNVAYNTIDNISAGGQTCIGAGLQRALDMLIFSTADVRDYVLMTDGIDSPSYCNVSLDTVIQRFLDQTTISQRFPPNDNPQIPGHHIHSIAFGPAADQRGLAKASALTGGLYLPAPDINDPLNVAQVFNTIYTHIENAQNLAGTDSTFLSPGEHVYPFLVTSALQQQTLKLFWDDTTDVLALTLEMPDGTVISDTNWHTFPGVTRKTGPAIEYFTINAPVSGTWLVRVTAAALDTLASYSWVHTAQSNLQLQVNFDDNEYAQYDTIRVLATLNEGGLPLTGATLEALVEIPPPEMGAWLEQRYTEGQDGEFSEEEDNRVANPPLEMITDMLTLFDDGSHGDGTAGDGVYGNFYTNTATLGTYTFSVSASGTSPNSGDFLRNFANALFVTLPPEIAVSDTTLDFGDVVVNTTKRINLFIYNAANTTIAVDLEVSGIESSDSAFIPKKTAFTLAAGRSDVLPVNFTPTTTDSFQAILTVHSNDVDDPQLILTVIGRGIPSPTISASTDSLTAQLTAGDSTTETLTFSNTGGSNLMVDILFSRPSAATSPSDSSGYRSPTAHIPDEDFAALMAVAVVNNIPASNLARNSVERRPSHTPELMYFKFNEEGQRFTENFAALETTVSDFAKVNRLIMGGTGESGTALWGGEGLTSDKYFVNTFWATDLPGDWAISLWLNGLPVSTFPYYLWGDVNAGSQSQSFRCFTGWVPGAGNLMMRGPFDDVLITGVAPGPSVVDIVYDSSVPEIRAYVNGQLNNVVPQNAPVIIQGDGPFKVGGFDDKTALPDAFLDNFKIYTRVSNRVDWMSVDTYTDTIPSGSSIDIPVHINAAHLNAGSYSADIRIISNDREAPEVNIPVSVIVSGDASILASSDSLDFGNVFVGGSDSLNVKITNPGTSLLSIGDVHVDSTSFVLKDSTAYSISPGDSIYISVAFEPSNPVFSTGTLTILSNALNQDTLNIILLGTGLPAPEITVNPGALADSLFAGESSVKTLVVYNGGVANLNFGITIETPGDSGQISGPSLQLPGGDSPSSPTSPRPYTQQPRFKHLELAKGERDPRVGIPLGTLRGGSDSFGYVWRDSDEPGGPNFQWNDISTTGIVSDITDDDGADWVDIGFTFNFYGTDYQQVMIGENGYLSFINYGGSEWDNQPIPDPFDPNNMIACFWDDLYIENGGVV
ncbi:MAG: choice-of-anchor D domain-containing protein, partial [Calditrichia bacterium]